MVRANGAVLSDVRYKELIEEQAKQKPTVAQKVNMFFFDRKQIALSDFLWFYGTLAFGGLVAILCYIALHSI